MFFLLFSLCHKASAPTGNPPQPIFVFWRFLIFPRHIFFKFCCRFHTVFLKMAAWAVLHFNIAHQRTSTSPGTQTVLCNSKSPGIHSCASLLSARRSYCRSFSALAGQYMFFEPVISGDLQSCQTVLDLWASYFRGLIVLRTVIFRGLLYSPGTILLPWQSCRQ